MPRKKLENIEMVPAYAALEHGLKKEWIIEEYFSYPAVEKDLADGKYLSILL